MIQLQGEVVRDDAVAGEYPEAASVMTPALAWWPKPRWALDKLVSFDVEDALVTSVFTPVDLRARRLFLNQSYENLLAIFPTRFKVSGSSFEIASTPVELGGRHVVLGGPVDRVWYHWLFDWSPRLMLLRWLRPELLQDPEVRFLVHPAALEPPFRSILDTFRIDEARLVVADPAQDYRLERATLVSFSPQSRLHSKLLRDLADHLLDELGVRDAPPTPSRRVFASRQPLTAPRRRIANFDELAPLLNRYGFDIAALGALPAREQARLFYNAEVVLGGHGSDLSNLLFCRPGTDVVVVEGRESVQRGLDGGLKGVCDVLGLHYHGFVSDVTPCDPEGSMHLKLAQDYVVDVHRLEGLLHQVTSSRARAGRTRVLTATRTPVRLRAGSN